MEKNSLQLNNPIHTSPGKVILLPRDTVLYHTNIVLYYSDALWMPKNHDIGIERSYKTQTV